MQEIVRALRAANQRLSRCGPSSSIIRVQPAVNFTGSPGCERLGSCLRLGKLVTFHSRPGLDL